MRVFKKCLPVVVFLLHFLRKIHTRRHRNYDSRQRGSPFSRLYRIFMIFTRFFARFCAFFIIVFTLRFIVCTRSVYIQKVVHFHAERGAAIQH